MLRRSRAAEVRALGFKLASEEDLDRAASWFGRRNLPTAFPEVPHQGRTLRTADIFGTPLDLYAQMQQSECMLQKYAAHQGARIQRIDHLNCFTPDVQASYDFYAALGFRLTEYTETEGADPKLWAVWLHRKGNVHDLAFTNGVGPRLHHVGLWTAGVLDIIHICDVMATCGYLANMERGPGRHGISNAFFLYVRDPDGHRVELFTSDYLTVDPDHAPIRWSLTDPRRQTLWGHPAPASWFKEGSLFAGVGAARAGARRAAGRGDVVDSPGVERRVKRDASGIPEASSLEVKARHVYVLVMDGSQPAVAEVAALVGNPARANILMALMDGRALTASELAYVAGVSPQTASEHLARLTGGESAVAHQARPAFLLPPRLAEDRAHDRRHHGGRRRRAAALPAALERRRCSCARRAPVTIMSPAALASALTECADARHKHIVLTEDGGMVTRPARNFWRGSASWSRKSDKAAAPFAAPASTGASGGRILPARWARLSPSVVSISAGSRASATRAR